ncbi:MAG: helix-turn-helix domain-containing protein [Candidatus Gallimonas sp.]
MISYEPFWKTLRARGESTYTLINRYGISSATIDRIRKGGGISTTKVDDFCKILHCRVEDVLEFREEE